MILTKDNLMRYVKEKKYVTPTHVADSFETTTMIASAALSELAKEKLISITFLKLSASPYYYDSNQKEALMDLAEKHFSSYDKDVYLKLKQNEILSENALSIQEKLAIERIKDFAKELLVEFEGKDMRFWVWYMRDLGETRRLISEALNQNKTGGSAPTKSEEKKQAIEPKTQTSKHQTNIEKQVNEEKKTLNESAGESTQVHAYEEKSKNLPTIPAREFKPQVAEENKVESFIEKFLFENYMKIESKNKSEKGILYNTAIKVNKVEIEFDCFYYFKKTTEAELISFYTSSLKPKIVFIENCPKKLYKLAENISNLTIINI